ncbi:MBL fold metallo-hydrolase [Acinetobacter sp. ANC 5414]|uniref:MBL fold metallo-hydrolase n=1 Tax=Acinetobacter sp. ANC 5414 TaxID=2731251 RepID=UPI0014902B6E|nr:MBL fold metallo-hydrolase [Acinetobacter sp. ANC 5414]NNH01848.1 MBL fold metallo-hydrolase [Acinetobacter sp. ANC 5414]
MSNSPVVKDFFHEDTNTFSYVVSDPSTKACAIIDSVLDYDAASATTLTTHADQIIAYIQAQGLTVEWILETHVHADHLTAAQYLKQELGGKIAISQKIAVVQQTFAAIYHLDLKQVNANQPFDHLFEDGEHFKIGELDVYNIPTPGHTPACLSYVVEDAVFVGDTLFMPDYGTARCDFPKGSAEQLFDSVQSLYQLPEDTRVFLCHDYLPETREAYVCETNIQAQKTQNIHIHEGISKAEFTQMRNQRDAGLSMPKLILPSIQINMKGGQFPEPEENGVSYLKLPLNYFK